MRKTFLKTLRAPSNLRTELVSHIYLETSLSAALFRGVIDTIGLILLSPLDTALNEYDQI